ncbi:MAG: HDIG domain-containing protein [Fibrobacteres bacterium]|nr:HDIG domain-containing protein [Fibrobacterota bacterium]
MADTVQMPKLPGSNFRSSFLSNRTLQAYLFVGWILILNLILPSPHGENTLDVPREGEITKRAYIAPFTFDLLKTKEEIAKERRDAVKRVPFLVRYDYEVSEKVIGRFKTFEKQISLLRDPSSSDSVRASIYKVLRKELSVGAITLFTERNGDPAALTAIAERIMDNGIAGQLFVKDEREVGDYREKHNVDPASVRIMESDAVVLIKDGVERGVGIGDLLPKEAAIEKERGNLRQVTGRESIGALYEILYAWTVPNIISLEEETAKRKDAAANSVIPTMGKVVKDLEIVGKNKLVTTEIARSLYSLKVAQEKLESAEKRSNLLIGFMRFLFLSLIMLPFFIWAGSRLHADKSLKPVAAFCVLITVTALIITGTWHLVNIVLTPLDTLSSFDFSYAYPLVFASILASVLFSVETGVVAMLAVTFIYSVITGFTFGPAFVHFAAGIAAALGLKNIRYRSQFFFSFLMYLIVAGAALMAYNGLKYGRIDGMHIIREWALMLASGLFSLMLAMTVAWLFERIFGIMTNLTLIELSDMNVPALKRLSIEAPGTYHHSVLVGNLTEAAAEKVGGNPLLGRVMAYYHDLGKVYKPEYFIENSQNLVDTLHGKVSPRMSAIIIAAHVKQGMELARKYRLPTAIQDAIREHHGTTFISFFYDKAKELEPEKQLMREDFCYPGPKPRSKETAILMLADSVEAASRTLNDSTPSRLRNLVEDIIQRKIQDRQLSHCELTLQELELIRESFVNVLTAMFHSRIEYPGRTNEE